MSWREKMDPETLARLNGQKPDEGGKADPKPTAWKLVWKFGGKDEVIKERGTYKRCAQIRKGKQDQPQYKSGTFKILPLFD